METKVCKYCKEEKLINEFYKRADYGTEARCIECRKVYDRKRYEKKRPKKCEYCGGVYRKRDGESTRQFQNRKYCGHNCARKAQWEKRKADREKLKPKLPACGGCGRRKVRSENALLCDQCFADVRQMERVKLSHGQVL